jgi:hypothetical protein
MKPGVRSSPYLTMLEESKEIVLLGGDTESGPISDLWLYDLDSEIVNIYTVEIRRYERKSSSKS